MPTVLRQEGFNIKIYTDDHPPPHVHVWRAGDELTPNLGDERNGVAIRARHNLNRADARRAVYIVEDNRGFLLQEWRRIHGNA